MKTRQITPYIVSIVVVAFLGVLAYIMFFAPKMEEARALEAETAAVAAVNDGLAVKVALIEEKKADLDGLKDRVSDFHKAFPAGASQKDLMDAITGAAQDTGVQVTSLNPSVPAAVLPEAVVPVAEVEPAPTEETPKQADEVLDEANGVDGAAAPAPAAEPAEPSVAIVGLTINATGSDEDLRSFLKKLESLKRPVVVNEFELAVNENEGILTLTGESFLVAPLDAPGKQTKDNAEAGAGE